MRECPFIGEHMINSVGPTHYKPKEALVHKAVKGPVWKHSKSKRDPPKDLTEEFPGPGHYNQ